MTRLCPSSICQFVALACASIVAGAGAMTAQQGNSDTSVAARVEALTRTGDTVQAESVAHAYLLEHPASGAVQVALGDLEIQRRHWPEAMDCFEAALRLKNTDESASKGERDAAMSLALHQHATGDESAALATLQRAGAALPGDETILLSTAVQAQRMHRLNTALTAANAALTAAPGDKRALYTAAGVHFDRGELAAATDLYRQYLRQEPDDASAHFGLGRALRLQQEPEEARRELERSIALQPVQTEAYYQLGELALASGDDDAAKQDYLKVLSRMPTHAGALTGLGILAFRAHQYEPAHSYLDRAIAADPNYQAAHYYCGLTLRKLGDTAKAEEELRIAVELAARQQGKGSPVGPQ